VKTYRCIEGRLYQRDPLAADPSLETDIRQCLDCSGAGCGKNGEPVGKSAPKRAAA
jgi:hypothetical protein